MSTKNNKSWKIWALVPIALAYLGFSSYAVLALFTDSEIVDANTFTTGTIDLTTNPTTAAVTFANMAPGDAVAAAIEVANAGTLDYRYSVTSTTTEDVLAPQLEMTIRIEASAAACTTVSAGVPVVFGPAGDLGSTGTDNIIGNPATGADAGDRDLAAGASEFLCFQVSLPTATGNAFQGITTSATFTFDAEQTANN